MTTLAHPSDWDDYFMGMARHAATKSKDRSVKVGAVIVGRGNAILSTGWNGFPRGVDDYVEERHERPTKYLWTEHAERNAIFNAASLGVPLWGSTLYTTLMPCCDCARAIIQSGIHLVVTPEPEAARRCTSHHDVSSAMFAEAGVTVRIL